MKKVGCPNADVPHLVVPATAPRIRLYQAAAVSSNPDRTCRAESVPQSDGEVEVTGGCECVRVTCSLRRAEREKEEVGKVAIACWHLPFVEAVVIGPVENNAAAVIMTRGQTVGGAGLSRSIERVAVG